MNSLPPRNAPIPKKSLGQHFLTNPQICRRIAGLLAAAPDEQILEIGPGPGALTQALREIPHGRLLLVEKDDWWADQRMREGGADVWHMDIMRMDWDKLGASGRWKLAGNLPYNIASPLIWNILENCHCWDKAVFMTQKEVAERICATTGSRTYGALSIWAQCHAQTRLEFTLGPGAFTPPPKVNSAVVSFRPLISPPLRPDILKKLLHICFQQRRKQIGGIFRKNGHKLYMEALDAIGIDPHSRPEQLECRHYLEMSEWLGERQEIPVARHGHY